MKEYINTSNQKIIYFALMGLLLNLFSGLYAGRSIVLILLVAFIYAIIIVANKHEKYEITDETITRKKLFTTVVTQWEEIEAAFISGWYIKIKAGNNTFYTILKKKDVPEVFADLKKEIISRIGADKIEIHEDDNEEGLKQEGALNLVYAYAVIVIIIFALAVFVYTGLIFFGLLGYLSVLQIITSIISVIGSVILVVINILVLMGFKKKARNTIALIKRSQWLSIAAYVFLAVAALSLPGEKVEFFDIISYIGAFGYMVSAALMIFEYLKSSERVRHFFVKD